MAAGTIGVLIGIGLLTLMLPSTPDGESAEGSTGGSAPRDARPGVTVVPTTAIDVEGDEATAPPISPIVDPSSPSGSGEPSPGATATPVTGPDATSPPVTDPGSPTTATSAPPPVVTLPPLSPPSTVHLTDLGAVALPLSSDGYLVTTASAVAGRGNRFSVTMSDGRPYPAMLISTGDGLAILRMDMPGESRVPAVAPAAIAEADGLPGEGSWVTVFGTTTARAVLVSTDGGLALAGLASEDGLLEGAPVVDSTGKVVGLCTRSRGTTNVVLAHAAHQVKDSAKDQAWLGVAGAPGQPDGDDPPRGVRVVDVLSGSPAAAAGLLPGDDIVRFDEVELESILELADLVATAAPGDVVTLTVLRAGVELEFELTLGSRPFAT